MRNSTLNTRIIEIISALFIFLFVYTGISKLSEHSNFRSVISHSPLIRSQANFYSWFLPIAELVVALLLLIPVTRKWGLWISLVLMCLFTGYIAYMILSSSQLPCSCGGVLKQMSWSQHLAFNGLFTIMAGLGLWFYQTNKRFIAINRISRTPV